MDKLSAYSILGLDRDASLGEIKDAYARLSKEYHPEENPEEFQRIHEAYTTLTRRGRRANHTTIVETSPIVQREVEETKESDLVFRKIDNYVEVSEKEDSVSQEYDFEKSVRLAKVQEDALRKQEEEKKKEQYDFESSIQQAKSEEMRNRYSVKQDIVTARKFGIVGGIVGGIAYPLWKYGAKFLKRLSWEGVDPVIICIGIVVLLVVVVTIAYVQRKKKS